MLHRKNVAVHSLRRSIWPALGWSVASDRYAMGWGMIIPILGDYASRYG